MLSFNANKMATAAQGPAYKTFASGGKSTEFKT